MISALVCVLPYPCRPPEGPIPDDHIRHTMGNTCISTQDTTRSVIDLKLEGCPKVYAYDSTRLRRIHRLFSTFSTFPSPCPCPCPLLPPPPVAEMWVARLPPLHHCLYVIIIPITRRFPFILNLDIQWQSAFALERPCRLTGRRIRRFYGGLERLSQHKRRIDLLGMSGAATSRGNKYC